MLTKKKLVGVARGEARKYRTVINWAGIGALIFWAFVILLILANL